MVRKQSRDRQGSPYDRSQRAVDTSDARSLTMQDSHGNAAVQDLVAVDAGGNELESMLGGLSTTGAQRLGSNLLYAWSARDEPARARGLLTSMHGAVLELSESVAALVEHLEAGTPQSRATELQAHALGFDEARAALRHLADEVGSVPADRAIGGFKHVARLVAGPLDASWRVVEGETLLAHAERGPPGEVGALLVAARAIEEGPQVNARFSEKFLLATAVTPVAILQFWLTLHLDVAAGDPSKGMIRLEQDPSGQVSATVMSPIEMDEEIEDLFDGGMKVSERGDMQLRLDGGGVGLRVDAHLDQAELVARLGPGLQAGPLHVAAELGFKLRQNDLALAYAHVLAPAALAAIHQAQTATALAALGTFTVLAAGGAVIAVGPQAVAMIESGVALGPGYAVAFEPAAALALGAAGAR